MTKWKGGRVGMEVSPVASQEEKESRILWRKLKWALLYQPGIADVEKAIANIVRHNDPYFSSSSYGWG